MTDIIGHEYLNTLLQLDYVAESKKLDIDVMEEFGVYCYLFDYIGTVKIKLNRIDYALCKTSVSIESKLENVKNERNRRDK